MLSRECTLVLIGKDHTGYSGVRRLWLRQLYTRMQHSRKSCEMGRIADSEQVGKEGMVTSLLAGGPTQESSQANLQHSSSAQSEGGLAGKEGRTGGFPQGKPNRATSKIERARAWLGSPAKPSEGPRPYLIQACPHRPRSRRHRCHRRRRLRRRRGNLDRRRCRRQQRLAMKAPTGAGRGTRRPRPGAAPSPPRPGRRSAGGLALAGQCCSRSRLRERWGGRGEGGVGEALVAAREAPAPGTVSRALTQTGAERWQGNGRVGGDAVAYAGESRVGCQPA